MIEVSEEFINASIEVNKHLLIISLRGEVSCYYLPDLLPQSV